MSSTQVNPRDKANVTASTELNDYTLNAGADIAFCVDGDDTELPYKLLKWTDNGANIDAWFKVRVPSVDSASDTDLRMHLGKAGGTAYSPSEDTFNENGAGYFKCVQGYDGGSFLDYTSNDNDGSDGGTANDATGAVADARDFVAADTDTIDTGVQADVGSVGTIVVYINPDWSSGDSTSHWIWASLTGTNFIHLGHFSTNNWYCGWSTTDPVDDDRLIVAAAAMSVSAGTWYQLAFTWDDAGNTEEVFLNGVSKGSRSAALTTVGVGANVHLGVAQNATFYYDGQMDEFSVSSVVRGTPWLLFDSNNTLDYGNTITHGAWTASGQPQAKRFGGVPFAALNRGVW